MNRREVLKATAAALVAGVTPGGAGAGPAAEATGRVERWDVFELALRGPTEGNPFLDVWLKATFRKPRFDYYDFTVDVYRFEPRDRGP